MIFFIPIYHIPHSQSETLASPSEPCKEMLNHVEASVNGKNPQQETGQRHSQARSAGQAVVALSDHSACHTCHKKSSPVLVPSACTRYSSPAQPRSLLPLLLILLFIKKERSCAPSIWHIRKLHWGSGVVPIWELYWYV